MKYLKSNWIWYLLLIAYLCTHFISESRTVDRIAPQFFYLSVLNSLTFLLFSIISFTRKIKVNYSSILFFLYIIISLFSFTQSINLNESILIFNQELTFLISFISLSIIISQTGNFKIFFFIVFGFFIIELSAIYFPIINDLLVLGNLSRSNNYRGFTGNINIASFSILYKIPILFYLYLKTNFKKLRLEILIYLITSLGLMTPYFLGTRAGYLGSTILFLIIVVFLIYKYSIKKALIFVLPFFILLFLTIISLKNSESLNIIERAKTISLQTTDGSVNQRLRYYNHAIDFFIENPFLGGGIGNWKLYSIKYDKEDIFSYIIPYHAHNDLLQVLVETGIFGLLFYSLMIVIPLFFLIKRFGKNPKYPIFLLSFLMVYSIDMLLNFPKARPVTQLFLFISIILISNELKLYYNSKNQILNKVFLIITLLLSIGSIYPSYKYFNSYKEQVFLAFDWDRTELYFPWQTIKDFEEELPNLSATTLPIKAMKSRYLIQEKQYDKAFEYLNLSIKTNPFLGVQEVLKAQAFVQMGNLDSAYVNAKKAYFKLSNNEIHTVTYFSILGELKKHEELTQALKLRKHKTLNFWNNYFLAMQKILGFGNQKLINQFYQVKKEFSNPESFIELEKFIVIGNQNYLNSIVLANEADKFFKEEKLKEAFSKYSEASDIDPTEYTYLENLGIISFKLNKYENALKYFDKVLNNFSSDTGKSEYYKSVILLDEGKFKDPKKACELLKISLKKGFTASKSLVDAYCN